MLQRTEIIHKIRKSLPNSSLLKIIRKRCLKLRKVPRAQAKAKQRMARSVKSRVRVQKRMTKSVRIIIAKVQKRVQRKIQEREEMGLRGNCLFKNILKIASFIVWWLWL